jgi:hypothetical protein
MLDHFTNFGGLVPKAQPRALPDNGAQSAENILATTTEFRPHGGDVSVVGATGVSNPAGLYRLARKADGSFNTNFTDASSWKVDAGDVNYVKSPLNDNSKEWTYKTFNDGSAAPREIDVDGGDRQLGVPQPATAPTVTVNAVAQFSMDDRSVAITAAQQQAIDAIKAHLIPNPYGDQGTPPSGYVNRTTGNGFTPENQYQQVRLYRITGTNATIDDTYNSVPASQFSWVFDPSLTPFRVTYGGNLHTALAFTAFGHTYNADETPMGTALAAILMPGKTDGTKLLTSPQVTELVARVHAYLDPANQTLAPMITAITAKANDVRAILDGTALGSIGGTAQAFYAKTDVAASITAAIAAAAEQAWQGADSIVHSSAYIPGV